jgi:hypothetical protein
MNLCKYKNLFGNPGEGLRQYRIFDLAIFDFVVVFIFTYFIKLILNRFILPTKYNISYPLLLILVLLLGIVCHRIFCVRTGLDKKLFPDLPTNITK